MTDTLDYRGKVRARDRETSWIAASAQTTTKTAALQILIYELLIDSGPLTDDAIRAQLTADGHHVTPSGIRTRRHELFLAGWVVATDKRGLSEMGSPATVWRAVTDEEPAPAPRPEQPPQPATRHASGVSAKGLDAARIVAHRQLGDADWADLIIQAYLNPGTIKDESAPMHLEIHPTTGEIPLFDLEATNA